MNIVLSEETQRLLEERMKRGGFATADDALRNALQIAEDFHLSDDCDEETVAAIEEGLAQADRGEGRPWEEVKAELRAKYFPGRS